MRTAVQANIVVSHHHATGSEELHAMLQGNDAASEAMRVFYADGDLTTAVALKGHHSFIQIGRTYELIRERHEHVENGFESFEAFMLYEYRLPAALIHSTMLASQIARRVLAEEPGLFLHEVFIRPTLRLVASAENEDAGIREAADLVLALAAEHGSMLYGEVVRKAACDQLKGRAV